MAVFNSPFLIVPNLNRYFPSLACEKSDGRLWVWKFCVRTSDRRDRHDRRDRTNCDSTPNCRIYLNEPIDPRFARSPLRKCGWLECCALPDRKRDPYRERQMPRESKLSVGSMTFRSPRARNRGIREKVRAETSPVLRNLVLPQH